MQEPYVDPDTARLLESLKAMGGGKLSDLALADARAAAVFMTQQLDLPCTAPCSVASLTVGAHGTIPARLYTPTLDSAGPVIIYVHGGGWVLGDLDICDRLCRHIATRSAYRVLSPAYRLAPEHPFPAAIEDVQDAVSWAASSPAVLGQPVTAIALAGDSAGATLSAAAALSYDATAPLLALLMLYPVTDISRTAASYDLFAEGYVLEAADMRFFVNSYAPGVDTRTDPRASPLLAANLAALPPTTLLTCGLDVLRDEGRAFAARLALSGVDVTYSEARGHVHGIATMRRAVPSACIPIDRAIDDFVNNFGRTPATSNLMPR